MNCMFESKNQRSSNKHLLHSSSISILDCCNKTRKPASAWPHLSKYLSSSMQAKNCNIACFIPVKSSIVRAVCINQNLIKTICQILKFINITFSCDISMSTRCPLEANFRNTSCHPTKVTHVNCIPCASHSDKYILHIPIVHL